MQRTARFPTGFPRLNRRLGLLLVLAAVAFILLLFTLFIFSFNRQRQQQVQLESELRQNRAFLATASPVVGRIDQLEIQLQNAQRQLATAQVALPGTEQQVGIVQRILTAAEQSNVTVTRLEAVDEVQRDGALVLTYDLVAEGDVRGLGEFTRRLEQEIFPVARLSETRLTQDEGLNRLAGSLLIYSSTLPGGLAVIPTLNPEQRQAQLQAQLQRALAAQDYELALSTLTRLNALNPQDPELEAQRYRTLVAYGEYLLALGRKELAQGQCEAALDVRANGDEAALCLLKIAADGTITVTFPPIAVASLTATPTTSPLEPTLPVIFTPAPSPTFGFPIPDINTPTSVIPPIPTVPTLAPPPTRTPPPTIPLDTPEPTNTRVPTFTPLPTETEGPTPTPSTTPTQTGTPGPSPTPTFDTSAFAFGSGTITYLPNCGLTQIRGIIRTSNGAALNGVRVIVWWDGMPRSDAPVSFPSGPVGYPDREAGYWDMTLQNYPTANRWYAEVVEMPSRRALSATVVVETNADCGAGGRQVALLDFIRYGDVAVGTTVPTSTITRTPSTTVSPSITLTPSRTTTPSPTNTPSPTPTPTPVEVPRNENPSLVIPDNPEERVRSVISIEDPQGTVRKAHVFLNVQHRDAGDLEINLISPTGKSVRLHSRGQDAGTANLRREFTPTQVSDLENVMRGEPINGVWILEIIDKIRGNDEGSLLQWELILFP